MSDNQHQPSPQDEKALEEARAECGCRVSNIVDGWNIVGHVIYRCEKHRAPASPAPHDTLREADMDGAGAQFGFCIVDRGPEDSHKMVVIYTEDDTLWHKVTRFSHVWLDDLARVISEAQSALAAQPTTTEIPAELGVSSSGGDEALREAGIRFNRGTWWLETPKSIEESGWIRIPSANLEVTQDALQRLLDALASRPPGGAAHGDTTS